VLRDATFLAVLPLVLGSRMPVYGIIPKYVRMFVCVHPLVRLSLRTHVPPEHSISAHAPSAQCALPGPLVPAARGRLRRRLGGRPGRVWPGGCAWVEPRASSASHGAAQPIREGTRGANDAVPTGLRVSSRTPCDGDSPAYDVNENGPPAGDPYVNKPAASYSPRPLRAKYHRR
jgi:hypothetical protein